MRSPLKALFLVLLIALLPAVRAQSCDEPSNAQINCAAPPDQWALRVCAGRTYSELSNQVQQAYLVDLAKLPEHDEFDIRKSKAQLSKAQKAWEIYTQEHCSYVGGLLGGANNWVSYEATLCSIAEMRKRLDFLTHLPQGG